MNNFIIISFILFLWRTWHIDISINTCIHNGKALQSGEKYNGDDECQICTCKIDRNDICIHIRSCSQMNCSHFESI